MNNQIFSPAFPTVPVQDKFGQVVVNFGFNKLEIASLIIAGHLAPKTESYLPETISEASVQLAIAVLENCDEELKKAIVTKSSIVTDGQP